MMTLPPTPRKDLQKTWHWLEGMCDRKVVHIKKNRGRRIRLGKKAPTRDRMWGAGRAGIYILRNPPNFPPKITQGRDCKNTNIFSLSAERCSCWTQRDRGTAQLWSTPHGSTVWAHVEHTAESQTDKCATGDTSYPQSEWRQYWRCRSTLILQSVSECGNTDKQCTC